MKIRKNMYCILIDKKKLSDPNHAQFLWLYRASGFHSSVDFTVPRLGNPKGERKSAGGRHFASCTKISIAYSIEMLILAPLS